MMYCKNCDSKLLPGVTRCTACGKSINEVDSNKKKSNFIPVLIFMILIVVILAIILYFIFS